MRVTPCSVVVFVSLVTTYVRGQRVSVCDLCSPSGVCVDLREPECVSASQARFIHSNCVSIEFLEGHCETSAYSDFNHLTPFPFR